jgi:deoxyribodipyrimidine photo-lyase
MKTSIWWLRRDLRLDDNPALISAIEDGNVVPVYIHAPEEEAPWVPGAASLAWLRQALTELAADLEALGSGLIVRSGPTGDALAKLVSETGATSVHWNRLYDPAVITRDAVLKGALREQGLRAESHNAALLIEPWQIATATGAPYRVFTPFWRNARARLDSLPQPVPAPSRLPALPALWSATIDSIVPAPAPAWDRGFWEHWKPGERGAAELLDAFIDGAAHGYREQRDLPDRTGTSRLSPHLHYGEISPRRIVQRLRAESWPAAIEADIEGYIRELGWREFSHHLLYHFPASSDANLNPKFDAFPWAPADEAALDAWRHGRTGIPLVDAGMRELWHTGWMHNRVRMVVASFLTKNLRQHWLHGARWFWDTLVDADLPNNTQGWQWTAGTGADAAPYFRVFNPVSQAQRFDAQGRYVRRWVPELAALPDAALFAPWEHEDLLRRVAPGYPSTPIVDLRESRETALAAYQQSRPM